MTKLVEYYKGRARELRAMIEELEGVPVGIKLEVSCQCHETEHQH